jgi:hypothetical protein
VQLRPSTELTHGELAALFTAAYEGYFVPFAVDEAILRYMVDVFDLDLGRSLVAVGARGSASCSRAVCSSRPARRGRPRWRSR